MTIQIAGKEDIEEITQVEIKSKKQSIPESVDAIEIDYPTRLYRWNTYFDGKSPKTSKPERLVLEVVENKKIIGYIAGHLTSSYEKDAEIQSFYILKEYQRKGSGTKLLARLIEWMIENKAKSLCVGISPDNKYQSFYLKHGGTHLNPHWIYWDNLETLLKKLK